MEWNLKRKTSLINELYSSLSHDEKKALEYFLTNISVGEIVAVRELEIIEGIKDPQSVLDSLVEKGLLERGSGCYNLSREARKVLREG